MTDPDALECVVIDVEMTGKPYTVTRDGESIAVIVHHDTYRTMRAKPDRAGGRRRQQQ